MSNLRKPTILAVDDKPELLMSIAEMLRDTYEIICVTSGTAALSALKKHRPQLFILDIEMPAMDGYELAKEIRSDRRFTRTPIIFLTGINTKESVVMAIRNGGSDYVLKPVNKEILIEKITKYIEGR